MGVGLLTLFAIAITEVSEMLGATPELADHLRALADQQLPAPADEHRGRGALLGRVGPALKYPIDAPAVPARPTRTDVDGLLAGQPIMPGRLACAWQIVLAWCDARSWARLDLHVDAEQLEHAERAVARAGLRVTRLDDPPAPLRLLPGQRFGQLPGSRVHTARQWLGRVLTDVDAAHRPDAQAVLEFLDAFDDWTQRAAVAGRPRPDIVLVWTTG